MKNRIHILLLLSSALMVTACDWNSQADDDVPPYLHLVQVQPALVQESYSITREFAGLVESSQNPVVSFELSGRVSELQANEGDFAAAGTVLARLDTRLLDAERQELQARSGEINADLELARRNLARVEQLESRQLASERERDELSSRVRLLESSLTRNEAALQSNLIRLEKSVLRAPFDAHIQSREADEGTVVEAGVPVFSLIATRLREIRAGVPVHLAGQLGAGDRVSVRVADDQRTGTVLAVGAVVDQGTRSRTLRLAVEADWAPGELAYLLIDEPVLQAGAWLPDTAVTEGLRGTWVAFLAMPDGDGEAILEKRSLTIHHARRGQLFVSGAMQDGDLVVSGGLHRVAPGQRVRLQIANVLSDARQNP